MAKRSLTLKRVTLKRVTRKRDIVDYAFYLAYTDDGDYCTVIGGDIVRRNWSGDCKGWLFYGPVPDKVKA